MLEQTSRVFELTGNWERGEELARKGADGLLTPEERAEIQSAIAQRIEYLRGVTPVPGEILHSPEKAILRLESLREYWSR